MSVINDNKKMSVIKRAYLKMEEMEARLKAFERVKKEPIAIVGMGCRFPGGIKDSESYWQLLRDAKDAIVEVPPDRWNADEFYDPDPKMPGKMSSKWGGFLDEIDKFDPQLFGISPREAIDIDPQQRLMLEVTWEALENAGQAPDQLINTATAVFSAICTFDYSDLRMGMGDLEGFDTYYISGVGPNMMSGRLSYVFGIQGPSVTVDTACSSSLTAIHLACQSLRLGESNMAIAGGANVIIQPHIMIAYSRAGLMALDGQCKAFDAEANGFVRGEGCGILILKRLSDALSNGDHIHALIKGSSINQDGPSSGLTAPNGPAQVAVIREALQRGDVDPASVGYVEAHGTGTPLGDPIEVQALGEALCKERSKEAPLVIGSVKTNIGHLEAAAGVAGLIKTVLSMQKGEIPPSLNFQTPNPYIRWDEIPVTVPTELIPWPSNGKKRIAGVSGFGFGGTNVHVVLEEAPDIPKDEAGAERPLHVLTLSAQSKEALSELATRFEQHIRENTEESFENTCFTANAGRSQFEQRLAILCESPELAQECLGAYGRGEEIDGLFAGRRLFTDSPKIAFLFNGDDSGIQDLGRKLYDTQVTFQKAIDQCDLIFESFSGTSLKSLLFQVKDSVSVADEMPYKQTALFALEYALYRLWRSWGIEPSIVMGYGTGEYVAACIAGVFSLEDGLRLAIERDRVPQVLKGDNPSDPETDGFTKTLSDIKYARPRLPMVSPVNGQYAKGEVMQAEYWKNPVRKPLNSKETISNLQKMGSEIFIQVGPASDLCFTEIQKSANPKIKWLVSLEKGQDPWSVILSSLCSLYIQGAPVNWDGFDKDYNRRRVTLPTYPFARLRCWKEEFNKPYSVGSHITGANMHPVLGERMSSPLIQGIVFQARTHKDNPSFISDHRIFSEAIFPAAGYMAHALEASRELYGEEGGSIEQLVFHKPMIFAEDQTRSIQIAISPDREDSASLQIFSIAENEKGRKDQWILHATGIMKRNEKSLDITDSRIDVEQLRSKCNVEVDINDHFTGMHEIGSDLGHLFQGIEELWHGDHESLARIALREKILREEDKYVIHPTLLDMAMQSLASNLMNDNKYTDVFLPIEIDRYRVYDSTAKIKWCHSVVRGRLEKESETIEGDINLYDESGYLVGVIEGVRLKQTDKDSLQRVLQRGFDDWFYEPAWQPKNIHKDFETIKSKKIGNWLIFTPADNPIDEFKSEVEARGGRVITVACGKRFETQKDQYIIDYKQPEDFKKLFSSIETPLDGVAFLLSNDPVKPEDIPYQELRERMQTVCEGILNTLQIMPEKMETGLPQLWIVTRGASQAGDKHVPPALIESAFLGLGRVIALEYPELNCKRLDLDPEGSDGTRLFFNEIAFNDGEDEIAYRENTRYVSRLVRADLKRLLKDDMDQSQERMQVNNVPVQKDGGYLVTGGLGNIGLQIAGWLVDKGARYVSLMGRSGPSQKAQDIISEWEQKGVQIQIVSGDITSENDVIRVIEETRQSMPVLRGVIHAAGVIDDTMLLKENWERFSKVLAPKVGGVWNLHRATQGMTLDFFIMFSSTSSLLPAYGQGSYTTANTFMDSFAHYRRSMGQPALSINWGVWSGGGMAATVNERERQRWGEQGVTLMEPKDAFKALEQVISSSAIQVVIIPIDWTRYFNYFKDGQVSPVLYELMSKEAKGPRFEKKVQEESSLIHRLKKTPANQGHNLVYEYTLGEVLKVLKLDSSQTISSDKPLREMGLDSLMAVELRDALSAVTGQKLPATLVFKYPTIDALADHLAEQLITDEMSDNKEMSKPGEAEFDKELEDLESMSETEVQQELSDELDSLSDEFLTDYED